MKGTRPRRQGLRRRLRVPGDHRGREALEVARVATSLLAGAVRRRTAPVFASGRSTCRFGRPWRALPRPSSPPSTAERWSAEVEELRARLALPPKPDEASLHLGGRRRPAPQLRRSGSTPSAPAGARLQSSSSRDGRAPPAARRRDRRPPAAPPCTASPSAARQMLREVFGHAAFRPGQEEIVDGGARRPRLPRRHAYRRRASRSPTRSRRASSAARRSSSPRSSRS